MTRHPFSVFRFPFSLVVLGALGGTALLFAACGGDDDGDAGPVITVGSTADTNERDGELTLREAILLANGELAKDDLSDDEDDEVDGDPGGESEDVIDIDVEGQTIALGSGLPVMTSDGDGVSGNGATVDGSAGGFACFEIEASNVGIAGLRIDGCKTGIKVRGTSTGVRLGGSLEGEGIVILRGDVGIEMQGNDATLLGSYIGIDPATSEGAGTAFEGLWITPTSRGMQIGGPGEGERNVISGNALFGVSVDGAQGVVIRGNYFGLSIDGEVAVANQFGINLQAGAFNNQVGGPNAGDENVISGNNTGLLVRDAATTGNTIQNNLFGVNPGRTDEIPNSVDVFKEDGSGENTYIDNLIATEYP